MIYDIFRRFIQILDDDKCLLILDNRHGQLCILLEDVTTLNAAIENKRYKKQLHCDKLGETCLMAYDERKRMLSVCATDASKVRILR